VAQLAHAVQVPNAPVLPPAPTLGDTVRSELTKLRTLRSTFWSFLVAAVIVIGLGALVSVGVSSSPGSGTDAFNTTIASWVLGQFAFLVLGVLTISNEYSTGLVTNTFLATPRRPRVLVAKVCSFTAVTIVLAEIMAFANFAIEHSILSGTGGLLDNFGFGGPDVLRAVIGAGLYGTMVGLMGMGLGTLLRHTAGAIVAGVLILLVLPGVANALPNSWSQPILKYWPTEAGTRVALIFQKAHTLPAWWGAADMLAFIVVLLVVAGWFMNARDS
jgi:ABC-2 type transport system permease protein